MNDIQSAGSQIGAPASQGSDVVYGCYHRFGGNASTNQYPHNQLLISSSSSSPSYPLFLSSYISAFSNLQLFDTNIILASHSLPPPLPILPHPMEPTDQNANPRAPTWINNKNNTNGINKIKKIAFVEPVFTVTAYSSFYTFYGKYSCVKPGQYVKTDLNLLNATLVKGWGISEPTWVFLKSKTAARDGIVLGNNTFVLTDVDVNNGALFFSNGTRKYDTVVLSFTEYVTQSEYDSYKQFVYSGGKLIFLDACDFLARVKYNPLANTVSLVEGHGWEFNGTAAWPAVYNYWVNDSSQWVGSRYALFETAGYKIQGAKPDLSNSLGRNLSQTFGGEEELFSSYQPHEENIITNPNDSIIATWNVQNLPPQDSSFKSKVAAYELLYGRGVVIDTGVFATDIISSDYQMQYFLWLAIFG